MEKIGVRCIVTGRVQGVGFRYWTEKEARSIGLTGTVRNLADGSVEVVASGPSEAVEQLLVALQQGPSAARVNHVETTTIEPTDFTNFRILR